MSRRAFDLISSVILMAAGIIIIAIGTHNASTATLAMGTGTLTVGAVAFGQWSATRHSGRRP